MPELKRFGAFRVHMFFEDHAPAHIHGQGDGYKAKLRIADGAVIAGDLPSRTRKVVAAWIDLDRAELLERWKRYGGG